MTRNMSIFATYQQGKSLSELASDYGFSRQRVWQIVLTLSQQTGEPLRKRKPQSKDRIFQFPDELVRDYHEGRKSARDVAEILGCSIATVWKRLGLARQRKPKQPNQSAVLIYRLYCEGKTLAEIEQHTGISRGTVGVTICRQRRKDPNPYYRYRRSP